MDQSTAMAYFGGQCDKGGNVEPDEYQGGMPVGYTEGGTMALNVVNWVDEPSMPPLQFAIPDEAFAEQSPSYSG
jgi:hypothetical protein